VIFRLIAAFAAGLILGAAGLFAILITITPY